MDGDVAEAMCRNAYYATSDFVDPLNRMEYSLLVSRVDLPYFAGLAVNDSSRVAMEAE